MSAEDNKRLPFEPEDSGSEMDYSKPFRAIVTFDCRPDEEKQATGDLSWQRGWCLGMYDFPDVTTKRPEGVFEVWIDHPTKPGKEPESTLYNPLIFTDSGHFIWGIQCYWGKDIEGLDLTFGEDSIQRLRGAIQLVTGGISQDNLGKN